MIALLFFLLRLLVSPFRSISRLEAENAALDTTPVWPFRRAISLPLSASQMHAVLSSDYHDHPTLKTVLESMRSLPR
jgi:hypothetical protein